MKWGTLQLLEVAALAAIAVPTHLLVARIRRPFVEGLEHLAGGIVRSVAAILDVVAFLLYLGFAAAAAPFGYVGTVGPQQIEEVLDTIGLFTLLVAAIQLVGLLVLHRVANNLEPWPPAEADSVSPSSRGGAPLATS